MSKKFSRNFIKFVLITKFNFSKNAPLLESFIEYNYENQDEFEDNLKKIGGIKL